MATAWLYPTTTDVRRIVIYHHGHGEDETIISNGSADKAALITALRAAGCAIAAVGVGNTWGNTTAVASYVSLETTIRAEWAGVPLIILAQSMGGASALIHIHESLKANAFVGIYPVCDLSTMTGGAYSSSISTAYGGSTTNVPSQNAYLRRVGGYVGTRFRFYASTGDTVVAKSTNSDAMHTKLSTAGIESSVVACSGDHGDASHFQPSDVVSWLGL